ncbi:MAG TPA: tetratricopeptide repeat protein [Myxococcota bacterium]|nr:tetratricopeptide repeat protein [Myxococcota bacterium]
MDETLKKLLSTAKATYSARDFEQARGILEDIVARHPGFADVHNMLGIVYHDAGLFSKAQEALEEALRINPRYTEAALNLAVLYNDLGKYAEARETYARALSYCRTAQPSLDPFVAGKIANMHAETAEAYQTAGHLDAAISEYGKALALRPTFADIRTRLARILVETRQHTLAADELQRALQDRPDYIPARVQLGICWYAMGRRDEAVRQWTQVLQNDPQNASAAMYLRLVAGDQKGVVNALENA